MAKKIIRPAKINGQKVGGIKKSIQYHISPKADRSIVEVDYGRWYCGVTNNTSIRKYRHKYEKQISAVYFEAWDAGTKNNALDIEYYFHCLGMKGKSKTNSPGGVRSDSTFVYVFKENLNMPERILHFFDLLE